MLTAPHLLSSARQVACDDTETKTLARSMTIRAFPTIAMWRAGKKVVDFNPSQRRAARFEARQRALLAVLLPWIAGRRGMQVRPRRVFGVWSDVK